MLPKGKAYISKRISNWPPSFCYILGKVFGEKYKQPNITRVLLVAWHDG